jgi:hypothetical protein
MTLLLVCLLLVVKYLVCGSCIWVHVSLIICYVLVTENQIVASAKEREQIQTLTAARTRADIRETLLVKMKSVTNADEAICISLLESNSFDLKTSIEAYFSTN